MQNRADTIADLERQLDAIDQLIFDQSQAKFKSSSWLGRQYQFVDLREARQWRASILEQLRRYRGLSDNFVLVTDA